MAFLSSLTLPFPCLFLEGEFNKNPSRDGTKMFAFTVTNFLSLTWSHKWSVIPSAIFQHVSALLARFELSYLTSFSGWRYKLRLDFCFSLPPRFCSPPSQCLPFLHHINGILGTWNRNCFALFWMLFSLSLSLQILHEKYLRMVSNSTWKIPPRKHFVAVNCSSFHLITSPQG